jgi:Phosphate-selective porin O and P
MSLALVLSLALSQAPVEAVAPPDVAPTPVVAPDKNLTRASEGSGTQVAGTSAMVNASVPWWQRVTLGGFARIGLFYTFPFRDDQLVGGNGGFRVADFRLGLDFHPIDKFSVYTSIELAAPLVDPNDPLSGRRIIDLRDAYVQYDVCAGFNIRVGQQRPPYYAEMLMSDGAIPFVNRSVLANGINPPEGFGPRNYLAPDRQLGVQFFSKRLGSTLGFKYAVGVFNGNGQNQLFNDNNSVEPVARVELDVNKIVTLGLNGYYNQRTEGVRPNRLTTNQLAYGADLSATGMGFTALVAFLGKSSTYSYGGLPPDSSLGGLAQVRYFHEKTGLEGAVRGAFFEPSTAQVDDQVIEIAAMIGWRPFELPFRVLAQYTHREEEKAASYPNDSVDVMIHAVW